MNPPVTDNQYKTLQSIYYILSYNSDGWLILWVRRKYGWMSVTVTSPGTTWQKIPCHYGIDHSIGSLLNYTSSGANDLLTIVIMTQNDCLLLEDYLLMIAIIITIYSTNVNHWMNKLPLKEKNRNMCQPRVSWRYLIDLQRMLTYIDILKLLIVSFWLIIS